MTVSKKQFCAEYDALYQNKNNDLSLAERAPFSAKDNMPAFVNYKGETLDNAVENGGVPTVLSAATLRRWIVKFNYNKDEISKEFLADCGLIDARADTFILFNDDELDYNIAYGEDVGCRLTLNSSAFSGGKRSFVLIDPEQFFFAVPIAVYEEQNDEEEPCESLEESTFAAYDENAEGGIDIEDGENAECSEDACALEDGENAECSEDACALESCDNGEADPMEYPQLDKPTMLIVVDDAPTDNKIIDDINKTDSEPSNDWLDGFGERDLSANIAFLDTRTGSLMKKDSDSDVYCNTASGVRQKFSSLCRQDKTSETAWQDVVKKNKNELFGRNERQFVVLLSDRGEGQIVEQLAALSEIDSSLVLCAISLDEGKYKYGIYCAEECKVNFETIKACGKAALKTIFDKIRCILIA